MQEACLPGFEISVWHAFYAPKGTPKAVIDKLVRALQDALRDPTVQQRFADLGAEGVAESRATPEALRAHQKAEIDRWARSSRRRAPLRIDLRGLGDGIDECA